MERLQWNEPASYRRAVARQRERQIPWESIKGAAFLFFVCIAARGSAEMGRPNPNLVGWGTTLVLAATVALLVAFGLPRLLLLLPNSIVILSDKGINNNIIGHGASLRFWPWSEISSCEISTVTLAGRQYRTLTAHDTNGREIASFGLKARPTTEELKQLLTRYEKHVNTDANQI